MFNLISKGLFAGLFFTLAVTAFAQAPVVTKIDNAQLATLLKPNGKPLVVNFWATWCEPCREEFPDLVKLDALYKGKADLITITLDDLAEINGDVPKFLNEMKSTIPTYLLHTNDQDAAITMVSKDWAGNLPLTMVYDANGKIVYQRNGKFRYETLKENIDRALDNEPSGVGIFEIVEFIKVVNGNRDEARYFFENNWRVFREAAVKRGIIESFDYIETANRDAAFDIILITRYANEEQYKNSEKAFEPILKELRPKGPLMKGSLKRDAIIKTVYSYVGKSVFRSVR
ncbi:MAG: TlpA family protein disulfide reductase [Blastocatellia bacterium]|nr:TlpA family protein disulfide reductase [Blastocatellia bacterium]